MPIGVCVKGHFTGFCKCRVCKSATDRMRGTVPPKLDRKQKRSVDQAIRDRGEMPLADMRTRWLRGAK